MGRVRVIERFALFATILFLSLSVQAGAPRAVIFFIHGINSDATGFCEFPEILEEQLENTLSRNGVVQVHALEYQTKDNPWGTTSDFAVEIGQKIAHYYSHNNIPMSTPYIFVAHSQGGLVGKKYIQNCLINKDCSNPDISVAQKSLPKNLKHFFTIGTPHHGSSGASFLIRGLQGLLRPGRLLELFSGGSQEQNISLAPGSASFIEDREFAINNSSKMKEIVTFHNIIGAVDSDEFSLISSLSLGRELESDMVVSTTSARQDFNYCVMDNERSPFKCGTTNLVRRKNVHLIDRKHSPIPVERDKRDMKCVERGVPNPSLDIVRKTLLTEFFGRNRDNPNIPKEIGLSHAIKNFAVDIHVYLPESFERPVGTSDLKIRYRGSDFKDMGSVVIEGGIGHQYLGANDHSFELFAPTVQQNSVSYFHIGRIGSPAAWSMFTRGNLREGTQTRKHWYQVDYPGFKSKAFEVSVTPGMTTYVKVYLESENQVEANVSSEGVTLGTHHIGSYNLISDLSVLYTRKTIKQYLEKYRALNECVLGVIAPTYPNGVPFEPVRYTRFDEAKKRPFEEIDQKRKARMLSDYPNRTGRHVRIHGSFEGGGFHRYLVSKPRLMGVELFWIDATDVDVLPASIIDKLEPHEQIHTLDVCK